MNTQNTIATITSQLANAIMDAIQARGGRQLSLEELTPIAELTEQLREVAGAEGHTAGRIEAQREAEEAQRFNGWPNYETWCIALWLDNDQPAYHTAREIVASCWENAAEEIARDRDAIVTPTVDAADALKDWLRNEENPLIETASLYSDLLGAALDSADWMRLADHFAPDPLPSLEPLATDDGDGDGGEEEVNCPACGGQGYDSIGPLHLNCPTCRGTGLIARKDDDDEEPDERYIQMTEREREGDC